MDIFKLFEATMANVKPGHIDFKDLRRDQLLDQYDDAVKTLQTLVKAKESEIVYRRDLINMLEKSKSVYEDKLTKAKQDYTNARKQAPKSMDLRGSSKKGEAPIAPATPPLPATPSVLATPGSQSSIKGADFDIPMPTESNESRSSLDRRLSEFLKTFPNFTQAGTAPTSNNAGPQPLPGYYTQQPPPPPPVSATIPPFMAMMRFPPPPMLPQPNVQTFNPIKQDNHDATGH